MSELLYLPAQRTVNIRPDFTKRPTRVELPRNKRPAWIALALASVWGAIGTVGLFHGLARMSTWGTFDSLAALGMAAFVTLLVIYFGVMAMRHYVNNDTIMLHDDRLEVTSYTLFSKTQWSASFAQYDGLKASTVKSGKTTYQLIELIHTDQTKTLPLYLVKGAHLSRDILNDLADRLGVTVLNHTANV